MKIKYFDAKNAVIIFIIFLLSNFISFTLGFLSKKDERAILMYHTKLSDSLPTDKLSFVLASKKGKKYYFVWCSAYKHIKPENRIFFKDEQSAKKAGYTASSSCDKD